MKLKTIKNSVFLACLSLVSVAAQAKCVLDIGGELGGVNPITFNIAAQDISIRADLPVDTSKPFLRLQTPQAGAEVNYIYCPNDVLYGGSILILSKQEGSEMYQTNIDGIGVKINWGNGVNEKYIPFYRTIDEILRLVFPAVSYYVLEFYKTADTVKLEKNKENTLLDGGIYSYMFVETDSPANYAQRLNVGKINVNSTPVCTAEQSKSIDFNTVTPSMADAGVERPLDFEMTCRTDYGSYSVNASIIASSRSEDGQYIMVTDAGENTDRLRIKISDNNGQPVLVDGTTLRNVLSSDKIPAQFKWKATLLSHGPLAKRPIGGKFNAKAEIVLQIN